MASKSKRTAGDQKIDDLVIHLHECVETLKIQVGEVRGELRQNTEVTEQVSDILGTFRFTLTAAKWLTAICTAFLALWHLIKFGRSA